MPLKTTPYFWRRTLEEHPEGLVYIGYVAKALVDPIEIEPQADGRFRHYIYIPDEDKYLRVIVEDGAVHNAHFDRMYKRRRSRS